MKKRQRKKLYYGTRRRRRQIILCAKRGRPAPRWTFDLTLRKFARWIHLEGYNANLDFKKDL